MKRKKSVPQVFTYKQPNTLRNFLTEQGTIIPRSLSGLALKKQRQLARAIKHARHLALLPFTQTI